MSARYFYVVYVGDPALQIALDTIRLLANPHARGLAHITVRGPYRDPPEYPASKLAIEGQEVRVTDVGDFFGDGQNTVFLGCESRVFPDRWYKPDYGYRPHITLYDGPSRRFAVKLKELLQQRYAEISFHVTGLSLLRSSPGEEGNALRRAFDVVGLYWVLGEQVTIGELEQLPDHARLSMIERVWRSILAHFGGPAAVSRLQEQSEAPLFEPWLSMQRSPDPLQLTPYKDLRALVADAYKQNHGGKSIDRILTDPSSNAEFVQACWRLGAIASQYELNRALLNARKDGYIGRIDGIGRAFIERSTLSQYLFASEVALRLVQDEEYNLRQRYVSLDRILCEPTLSYRFDQLARAIAPGHASSEYRWAAVFIRKCQHRRVTSASTRGIRFEQLGPLERIKPQNVSRSAGLYWLKLAREDVYIGNSEDLREEVERLSTIRLRDLPVVHRSPALNTQGVRVSIAPCDDCSVIRRDSAKVALVRENRPAMNVMVPHKSALTGVAL